MSTRNPGFIAVHRGGTLAVENHRLLNRWSRKCVERLLQKWEGAFDPRLSQALRTSSDWENGKVLTGACMIASREAHAVAREAASSLNTAIARAVGHAVATAHMADHSVGGALYGLKATQLAGGNVADELTWQKAALKRLPSNLEHLVIETLHKKGKQLKVL